MRQVGNYLLEDIPIGSGGMGHVYKGVAQDGVTPVAVKQILPNFVADEEYRTRIEREIEFLKKLHNDHVVHIYDHFEHTDGNLYIVMEYVDGLNIEQYVEKNGAIPWREAVDYMVQLLLTMQDVHSHGIIHRDIKPGNVMIRPNGQICLLDFGVAKDASNNNKRGGTVYGTVIGTDGYMSPEQAEGLSIDHRSDIYGLGCVLYYMITGTHVFGGMQSELKMQIAIKAGKFPRLEDKVSGLPQKLQSIMDNAVHKDMTKRYLSCGEFARDLSSLVSSAGTHISKKTSSQEVFVSIGRENCDICVGRDNMKVSRHHADITLKRFTGGQFLVYTDCSSNGTTIDGIALQRGMTHNIPLGKKVKIYLANDPSCRLDLNEVIKELERKIKILGEEDFDLESEMSNSKSDHENTRGESGSMEKKGIGNFFKNIFKSKKK